MEKKHWQTILFLAVCAGILVFFLMAPEATTPRMPYDKDHVGRQKDYALCFSCHEPSTMPEDHVTKDGTPPTGKFKCYFCHKLEDAS